jgi:transketolase
MTTVRTSLDELCVHTLRALSIDAVERAKSGHPGLPMGAAPMAYVLWQRHLAHDPRDPRWPNRDRFVLSAGHGSALLYSLLHLTGYEVSLDDLRAFRQWGSATPGHPEAFATPGVEATTGPLGQGAANSVGMAIAERALAARFNRPGHTLVDHFTYALVSDGDMMEGVVAEAASLAGELALGKLVWLYDSNGVSLDGPTALTFGAEDVAARFRAYGWHVQQVEDGDRDLDAIDRAIAAAKGESARPSLIVVRTTIGFGAPRKAGTAEAHGSPLGADEAAAAKARYGLEGQQPFEIAADARAHLRGAIERGAAARRAWERAFDAYASAHPGLAAELRRRFAGELPADFAARCERELPRWKPGEALATRDAGGKAENALAAILPELAGGDADLSSSTKTSIASGGSLGARNPGGRNVHFGVREHAMGSIANGIAYHGGLRPFVSTFFVFADYMRPPVRLAAMCHLPVIYVWTHDSIAVGEDGPTHQPVEHLASLRAMPGLYVVRPADANETAQAWRFALESRRAPVALVLSRQKLPVLAGTDARAAQGVRRGAYVLSDARGGAPQVLLIATGSEVALAVAAQARLAEEGVRARVVSMPCWRAFEEQDAPYRDSVLPQGVRARVSVEAGSTFGWERWIGASGVAVGLDRFGASAPGEVVLQKLGFTLERVVAAARASLERSSAP